jgi:hypothetical protein
MEGEEAIDARQNLPRRLPFFVAPASRRDSLYCGNAAVRELPAPGFIRINRWRPGGKWIKIDSLAVSQSKAWCRRGGISSRRPTSENPGALVPRDHSMKRIAVATSVLLSLMSAHGVRAGEKHAQQPRKSGMQAQSNRSFAIQVTDGGWGEAKPEEVELLLNAIAAELLSHFLEKQLDPMIVSHSQQGPVVLYQKGPTNQYQIYLAAGDRRWGEYIYEFSHELFHILANYEYHAPAEGARHRWFEEMLCETVSLYTLKKLSLSWEQSAPRAEWASYAPELSRFTWRALSEPHRQLPENTSFAQWFQENGSSLVGRPYEREKNELVAMLFLPLLEQHADWRAVGYLNLDPLQRDASFYDYLAGWHARTPRADRELPSQAMRLFHFRPPAASDHAAAEHEGAGTGPQKSGAE